MITKEERKAVEHLAGLENGACKYLAAIILREFPADDTLPVRDDEASREWLRGEGFDGEEKQSDEVFTTFWKAPDEDWPAEVFVAVSAKYCQLGVDMDRKPGSGFVINYNPTRRDVRALVGLCNGGE